MAKFRHHIFVCENERPADHPRGSCAARGGTEVREALKKECEKRGWKGLVRVNKAGCLDQCQVGVVAVVYPEQTWYGGLKVEDVPKLCDALERGETVAGLRVPDEHLTGREGSLWHSGNIGGGH